MELEVEVVQNSFLDLQALNLFSKLVIFGQDGIEMDIGLGGEMQKA